jgi:ankyrin repeat protein
VHRACETGRADVLREILARRGALPGFRAAMLDRDDASRLDTPLHAAFHGKNAEHLALVRALLEAGAWHSPLDVDDKTPLHLAAERGCAGAGCVRLLLEAGADPADRDTYSHTPLHLAAEHSCACACCVRELLQHAGGADATAHRDSFGCTPLHYARSAAAARRLLDAGADPNAVNPGGESPLHYAAYEAPDVARVLLAAGADPNLHNTHGMTALHFARTKEVVEILVGAGARLDARNNRGQTPLGRAITHGMQHEPTRRAEHIQLIEAMVAAGADPFAELGIARSANAEDVAAALIDKAGAAAARTLAALFTAESPQVGTPP